MEFDLDFATTLADRAEPGGSAGGKRSKAKGKPGMANVAEGIVVRSDVVLNQAALDAGEAFVPVRCLLKRKNARFAEVQDLETSYSAKEAARSYAFVFARMVNAQRLHGVLSKTVGRVTAANAEEVAAELAADVWEDFYVSGAGASCVIADQAAAEAHLLGLCRECVRLAGMDF